MPLSIRNRDIIESTLGEVKRMEVDRTLTQTGSSHHDVTGIADDAGNIVTLWDATASVVSAADVVIIQVDPESKQASALPLEIEIRLSVSGALLNFTLDRTMVFKLPSAVARSGFGDTNRVIDKIRARNNNGGGTGANNLDVRCIVFPA